MRVATINIPKKLNNGQPCPEVLDSALLSLLDKFGGATVVEGRGVWSNGKTVYDEPMNIVTVAMDVTPENNAALKVIAEAVAVMADQQAVYVIYADGEVEFIEQPKAAA